MKAKAIAPADEFYGREMAFDGNLFHINWYLWFAKKFADVPMRQAFAFFRKHEAASLHFMHFMDEGNDAAI